MIGLPGYHYRYVRDTGDWVRVNNDPLIDAIQMVMIRNQVAQRGGIDSVLYQDARNGRLNRNEFVALQAYQAETERLKAKFLEDGRLDENERRILQEREQNLYRLYAKYVSGDYHPRFNVGGLDDQGHLRNYGYDRQLTYQYGRIYDGITSGELTYREYNRLDNNLEVINRYRGWTGEFSNIFNPYDPVRSGFEYNRYLLDVYSNNWEREWTEGIMYAF